MSAKKKVIRANTGGGRFDKDDTNVFFLATWPMHFGYLTNIGNGYDHILCATNDFAGAANLAKLEEIIDRPGLRLMLDSGVFNLATGFARKNGITMDEALNTAPADMEGFDSLYATYTGLLDRFEDKLWGYVEIDLGGRENKLLTRAKLEKAGYRPIPVFHPLNDGWDYFEYLAQRYDRLCIGNVVNASHKTRTKLLHEVKRRWRKYPEVWLHTLGVSPNHHITTGRFSSCDSSSWVSSMRWGEPNPSYTLGERARLLPKWLCSTIGAEFASYAQATRVCATQIALHDRGRREHFREMKEDGL